MADEHDWRDERPDEDPVAGNGERPETPAEVTGDVGEEAVVAEAAHLLSAARFDDELARLESIENEGPFDGEQQQDQGLAHARRAESGGEAEDHADADDGAIEAFEDGERVRGPRAQSFRRRLRDQVSTLPLAAWLVALGAFLLARERGVDGLPELTDLALVEVSVLAVATTLIMHSVLSGRRERGLLFFGLWIWVTAGMIAALVYGIDDQPEVGQWWPLILWSLALTLLLTYLLERTHDARLVLLSTVVLVAGAVAYAVTSGRIGQDVLDQAADYWPLLFSILGIVLLPLVFRRRPVSR